MIKKFLAKLVSYTERKEDFAKSAFRADQAEQDRMAREKHEQVMAERQRKYISERTTPPEGKILGPSEAKPKEEK